MSTKLKPKGVYTKQFARLYDEDRWKRAIAIAFSGGVTSSAPLGFSGNTIVLYDRPSKDPSITRCSQVSVRMYCNTIELLITSKDGHFLYYGKLSPEAMHIVDIVEEFVLTTHRLRDQIKVNYQEQALKIEGFKHCWWHTCKNADEQWELMLNHQNYVFKRNSK